MNPLLKACHTEKEVVMITKREARIRREEELAFAIAREERLQQEEAQRRIQEEVYARAREEVRIEEEREKACKAREEREKEAEGQRWRKECEDRLRVRSEVMRATIEMWDQILHPPHSAPAPKPWWDPIVNGEFSMIIFLFIVSFLFMLGYFIQEGRI